MSEPNVVILLIVIATAVAMITRRIPIPYTAALVVTGIGLGALHLVDPPHLTRDLLFAVFLPGLVFEAAFHLPYVELRRNARAIIALAVPGVVLTIAITAVILVAVRPLLGDGSAMTWRQALVFAAIVAATDPIAVVALVRSLGAPPRLSLLLEAESLLNDGTAIVFFGLVLATTGGAAASGVSVTIDFFRIVGLGALVGLAVGAAASQMVHVVNDAMIEITLTVIAAYGSFVIADQIGGSGVIATVVAGVICGNYGATSGMSATTRASAQSFWDYVAFLLNSIVFLLMGFEVRLPSLAAQALLIVLAVAAGWVARGVLVSAVALSVMRTSERIPRTWVTPLVWGGLRGGLSMVLALSLPTDFVGRELVITATFGLVVVSILLQGTTMAALLRRLRLTSNDQIDDRR